MLRESSSTEHHPLRCLQLRGWQLLCNSSCATAPATPEATEKRAEGLRAGFGVVVEQVPRKRSWKGSLRSDPSTLALSVFRAVEAAARAQAHPSPRAS